MGMGTSKAQIIYLAMSFSVPLDHNIYMLLSLRFFSKPLTYSHTVFPRPPSTQT